MLPICLQRPQKNGFIKTENLSFCFCSSVTPVVASLPSGPWLLKAGWGPLARLQFAIDAGIARKDRPAGLVGLVRRSRVAFAAAHHPAYANFLRRRLDEEVIEEDLDALEEPDEDAILLHPKAWGRGGGGAKPLPSEVYAAVVPIPTTSRNSRPNSRNSDSTSRSSESTPGNSEAMPKPATSRKATRKFKNAGEMTEEVVVDLSDGDGDENEDEKDLMARTAVRVGQLEDALGRERKSRMGGVKDRPPKFEQSRLPRWQGNPKNGDAFLDLGRGEIVRRDPRIGP